MPLRHQQFAASKVMIMSAPNGARRNKQDHPELPMTPAELADCAGQIADAGASVLHLHVRDRQGNHSLDPALYRDAIAAVRRSVGNRLLVQVTTEAVGRYQPDAQMAVVRDLQPEGVSLALAELCPDDAQLGIASAFFAWLVSESIWPQYILYSADDLRRFDDLRQRGVFHDERPSCLLVLGRYADKLQGDISELTTMLDAMDCSQFPWSVCCFGNNEHQAALLAHDSGGHVRLGFENNLLLADGSLASDNADLIEQFTAATLGSPRSPATADDVRELVFSTAS